MIDPDQLDDLKRQIKNRVPASTKVIVHNDSDRNAHARSALDDVKVGPEKLWSPASEEEKKEALRLWTEETNKTATWIDANIPWDFMTAEEKIEHIKDLVGKLSDEQQVNLVSELAEKWEQQVIEDKAERNIREFNEKFNNAVKEKIEENVEKWAEQQLKSMKMPSHEDQVKAMVDGSAVYHVTGEAVEYKGTTWENGIVMRKNVNMGKSEDLLSEQELEELKQIAEKAYLTGPAAVKERKGTRYESSNVYVVSPTEGTIDGKSLVEWLEEYKQELQSKEHGTEQ